MTDKAPKKRALCSEIRFDTAVGRAGLSSRDSHRERSVAIHAFGLHGLLHFVRNDGEGAMTANPAPFRPNSIPAQNYFHARSAAAQQAS
jgi:hypothetical protein